MIEKINGAGLPGTTEKSTKSGKSSLFSKLLAMLEKNAEASGKGKGLQVNVDKSGKAKGLAGLTEKTDFAVAEKGKSLLTKVSKDKSEIIDKTDETATPLFAAHVIVDTTDKIKRSDQIAKSSILIGGQIAGQDAGKAGSKGAEKGSEKGSEKGAELGFQKGSEKGTELGFQKGSEKGVELGLQKGAEQAPDKALLNKVSEKNDAGNVVLNQKSDLASSGGDLFARQFKGESSKQGQTLATDPARTVVNKPVVEATVSAQKTNGSEQSVKAALGATPGQFETVVSSGKKAGSSASSRFSVEGKKAESTLQVNHSLGEKSAAKISADATSAAAGAQFQQAKALQTQQSQQVSSATMGVSVSQAGLAEASLGDSSSQFSDNKGGQTAQSLNTMLGDVKSTSASSSVNFQSYLTSKTPPPALSIFDSMNHIAQSAKNGQTRLEIQLDPANLGKIQISLQSDASKQLQVHMVVDQSMTRAALEQQLPQLRNALAQQGFDLSGFSMDSQGQQGQQASSDGTGNNGSKSNGLTDHSESMMTDSQQMQPQQTKTGSGLSIRV